MISTSGIGRGLIILLILSLIGYCRADSQSAVSYSGSDDLLQFAEFGFLKNGYFNITIDITSQIQPYNNTGTTPAFQVYGCIGKEFQHNSEFNYVCFYDPKCTITYIIEPGQNYISGYIDRPGYYYFLVSNCVYQTVDYTFSYVLTNPTNNHLSYELMPLPIILMVFTGIWCIAIILWMLNWIQNRTQRIKLHRVITLYPISKLIDVVYSLGYYQFYKIHGYTSLATVIMYWVLFIIFRIISIVVLLLIAAGWGILPYRGLTKGYRNTINGAVIILVICLGLGSFLGGYFNILSFIVYIPVLGILFVKTDTNIALVRASITFTLKGGIENPSQQATPAVEKTPQQIQLEQELPQLNSIPIQKRYAILHMFIAFKWIMLVFIGCTIVLQFLEVVLPYGWVFDLFTYFIEISLFICVAITFRLRPEKKDSYFLFDDDIELQNVN